MDIDFPERSVTRFFIPMIDVLLLLFCIYLLLPIARGPGDEGGNDLLSARGGPLGPPERQELERLRRAVANLRPDESFSRCARGELEQIRQERIHILQNRLSVQVLEVDPDSGKLYDREPDHPEINSEAAARALIDRHRRQAGGRELYYFILFPRRLTGFPEERQIRQYERWFHDVAHGYENALGPS